MKELEEKRKDDKSDMTSERGFSTDQRIEIENLNVRRQERTDRQRESNMVGLSIEEAAISRLIKQAERRAEARCAEYDPGNKFWKKVDDLLQKQDEIMLKMTMYNNINTITKVDSSLSWTTNFSPSKTPVDCDDESVSHPVSSIASDIGLESMMVHTSEFNNNASYNSKDCEEDYDDVNHSNNTSMSVAVSKKRVSTCKRKRN